MFRDELDDTEFSLTLLTSPFLIDKVADVPFFIDFSSFDKSCCDGCSSSEFSEGVLNPSEADPVIKA